MNYLSLISLILGLISIVITVKFVDNYEKLNKSLKTIKNISNNILPIEITNIQDELDLSQNELLVLFKSNKQEIINYLASLNQASSNSSNNISNETNSISELPTQIPEEEINSDNEPINTDVENLKINKKTEAFENYRYLNKYQRRIPKNNKVFRKVELNDKIKHKNLFEYKDEIKLSYKNISDKKQGLKLNDYDSSFIDEKKGIIKDSDFTKKNMCIVNYDDKQFSFFVNEPEFCVGSLMKCNN